MVVFLRLSVQELKKEQTGYTDMWIKKRQKSQY